MLDIQQVSKSYHQNKAVDDLSMQVRRGEIFGLVGSNGSGKTTTFRMILQLLRPDTGQILLDQQDICLSDQRVFGYLPEERSLYRELTLQKQFYFLGQLKGMSVRQIDEQLEKWMKTLEIDQYKDVKIKMLSKGNQQKVQFLGCLLHQPEICIFDEPFSGLDPYNVELMKRVFLRLREEGRMILLATHRLDHIESFCTRMLLLEKGKTLVQGEVSDLRKSSKARYIRVIGGIQYHQLKMFDEVMAIVREGKGYRLLFDNEGDAKKMAATLMQRKDVMHVSYELPTLLDLFMATREAQGE